MNIFKHNLDNNIYIPNAISSEFSNKNICFFDIETTGLSSKYNEVILIGVLCLEGDCIYIKQFFADHPDEEKEILTLFEEFLNGFEYIVSYNGKSFDIPFLKNRFTHYNILSNIDQLSHLDLLQLVRKNKDLLHLENCKLKTVEKRLNIYREDTISGKESVDLYKAYLCSRDKIKRDIILKHNYDDIFYLPSLLAIYDIIEKESLLTLDLEFKGIDLSLNIDKNLIQFKKSLISISGSSPLINLPSQVHYKDFYSFNWSTSKGIFDLELFYKVGSLSDGAKCIYLDLKDSDFPLCDFDKIGYNIADTIVLLKINDITLYKNISLLTTKIISQLD